MALRVLLFLATVLGAAFSAPPPSGKVEDHNRVVVCYIGTWAVYRQGGAFAVHDIEPALCTHIVYAFAGLNATDNTIQCLDPYLDLEENYGRGNYKKTTELKRQYPHLKVTLAVGGWNEGSTNFSIMAANPAARANFTISAIDMIKKYNFDGLDLDWEFPTKRGGRPEDKENFVSLVKELRRAFDSVGSLLLTAAISASVETIKSGYDLPALYRHLDLVHLMSYDYHGTWETVAGVNAPLRSSDPSDKLTVEESIDYVISAGFKADKLVAGIPFYGRVFTIDNPEDFGRLGTKASSPKDFQGPYTRSEGFLGYLEICETIQGEGWLKGWDNVSMTPFAYKDDLLITYDDTQSVAEKVKVIVAKGLAGSMVWSLDTDDFKGTCGDGSFPLMNAINSATAAAAERHRTVALDVPNVLGGDPVPPVSRRNSASDILSSFFVISLSVLFARSV